MRRLAIIALGTLALVGAHAADAAVVTRHDRAGRALKFDVRAHGVHVGWYASVLRGAIPGDEIETVRIRIVPRSGISRLCERNARSCYEGDERKGLVVVPAGRSADVAHMLLHEYAHHIDMARSNFLFTDKPWARSWWAARRVNSLLAGGKASFTYSRGWDRSVGEVFAEDYVQLNMRSHYYISWLRPPGAAIRAALLRDVRSASRRAHNR